MVWQQGWWEGIKQGSRFGQINDLQLWCNDTAQQGCQPNHRNRYLVRLTQSKLQKEIFSSPHMSRPALATTQAFPKAKGTECGADHPHLSSADVKKEYSYTSTHPLCLHDMLQGDLYLTQTKQVSVVNRLLKFKQRRRLVRILWQAWKEATLRGIIQAMPGRRYFFFSGVSRKNIIH